VQFWIRFLKQGVRNIESSIEIGIFGEDLTLRVDGVIVLWVSDMELIWADAKSLSVFPESVNSSWRSFGPYYLLYFL